jgi:hypothetical protein
LPEDQEKALKKGSKNRIELLEEKVAVAQGIDGY